MKLTVVNFRPICFEFTVYLVPVVLPLLPLGRMGFVFGIRYAGLTS
jgi:hypothetical protein